MEREAGGGRDKDEGEKHYAPSGGANASDRRLDSVEGELGGESSHFFFSLFFGFLCFFASRRVAIRKRMKERERERPVVEALFVK